MRPCRPRRRGHWGRHLSPISIPHSPLSSDSDAFPCDSSCSGESTSSQDTIPLSLYSRRHLRSGPPSHLSPISLPPNPHSLTTSFRSDIPTTPQTGPVSIRDVSLCEYAAAELPDLGFLFKAILPAFTSSPTPHTRHPLPHPPSSSTSRRAFMPPKRLNYPANQKHHTQTLSDSSRTPPAHMRVHPPSRNDAFHTVLSARDQLVRLDSSTTRSLPRAVRATKLSPGRGTRRFPDDIAISRQQAQRNDPDSMDCSFLLERLCSFYRDIVNSGRRQTPLRT